MCRGVVLASGSRFCICICVIRKDQGIKGEYSAKLEAVDSRLVRVILKWFLPITKGD